MSVQILPIREGHIESFHATLDVVAREHAYLSMLEAPPLEMARDYVRNNIAKGHPHMVAVDGARVVGWCDVSPKARVTLRHGGVLGMGLLPERRGQGLGRELMERTLEAARSFGFLRVELTVRADNARAEALYRKLGFEVEGCNRRAMLVDGVYHDLIMMALLFDVAGAVSDPAASFEASR